MFYSYYSLGCSTKVTTTNDEGLPYNDGKWHHLKAIRNKRQGNLTLDTKWKGLSARWLTHHTHSSNVSHSCINVRRAH